MTVPTTRRSHRRRRRSPLRIATVLLAVLTVVAVGVILAQSIGGGGLSAKELAKARAVDPARIRQATQAVTRAGKAPAVHQVRVPTTTSPTRWLATTVRFTYGGTTRQYLEFRPAGATGRLPVLMMISGSAKTAAGEAARSDFRQVAAPMILVYPQATDLSGQINWDAGACCGLASTSKVDDVGFLEAVIGRVRAQPDASSAPVYLAGYSNGGKMALLMACDAPHLFAGVAVYGAVPSFTCPDPPAVSLLELAGTADPELTIGPTGTQVTQNGFVEPRVTQVIADQLRLDGCTAATDEATAGGFDETTWATCGHGDRVGLGLYRDQTHTWPERNGATPSAQQVMWDWFVSIGAPAA